MIKKYQERRNLFLRKSQYDQEIPQSHNADQPTEPR